MSTQEPLDQAAAERKINDLRVKYLNIEDDVNKTKTQLSEKTNQCYNLYKEYSEFKEQYLLQVLQAQRVRLVELEASLKSKATLSPVKEASSDEEADDEPKVPRKNKSKRDDNLAVQD